MRRGGSWILALGLCVAGVVAACGGDDGSSPTPTTTTTASTEPGFPDPGAAVPEFRTKAEGLDALRAPFAPG